MASNAQKLTIIIVMGAALLLLNQKSGNGDDDGEGGPTAGDDTSNIIYDGVDTIMGMINGWPSGSDPYQQTITDEATAANIPVSILAWVLWKESRYRADIIDGTTRSRTGALGIAQFMPDTAPQWCGSVDGALDPATAIHGCANYLAWLFSKTGTWQGALAAYNWGIGNITRKGLAAAPAETVDYYTTILSKAGLTGSTV